MCNAFKYSFSKLNNFRVALLSNKPLKLLIRTGTASHMKRGREDEGDELDNMANCLMLITKVGEISETNPLKDSGSFRCKTCNREFSSFQALGGHRTSHKRSKLMVTDLSNQPTKPRIHLCPICGLEFGIGQALGGHMRKHRASIIDHNLPILKKSRDAESFNLCLDLNLTPC